MRYHLTDVRMVIINKSENNKCWQGCGEKGTLVHSLLVGMQTGAATGKQYGFTLWLRDSTSGNLCKETWNTNLKKYMHFCGHCRIIYNSKDLKAAQVATSKWVDKKAVVHLHNGILPGCKKEGTFTFSDSLDDLEIIMWHKPVKERQVPYDFICMWNLWAKWMKV